MHKDKEVRAAYQRAYREQNRERLLAQKRAYGLAHREETSIKKRARYAEDASLRAEISEKTRVYREAHRAEIAERDRKYRQANSERVTARKRAYEQEHREEIAAKKRAYALAHKEELAQKARARRIANPEAVRARKLNHRARVAGVGGVLTGDQIRAMRDWFGNVCIACGTVDKLTVDHVIPLTAGGTNDIRNTQPLCKPCNTKKGTKTTDYRNPDLFAQFCAARLAGNPEA